MTQKFLIGTCKLYIWPISKHGIWSWVDLVQSHYMLFDFISVSWLKRGVVKVLHHHCVSYESVLDCRLQQWLHLLTLKSLTRSFGPWDKDCYLRTVNLLLLWMLFWRWVSHWSWFWVKNILKPFGQVCFRIFMWSECHDIYLDAFRQWESIGGNQMHIQFSCGSSALCFVTIVASWLSYTGKFLIWLSCITMENGHSFSILFCWNLMMSTNFHCTLLVHWTFELWLSHSTTVWWHSTFSLQKWDIGVWSSAWWSHQTAHIPFLPFARC